MIENIFESHYDDLLCRAQYADAIVVESWFIIPSCCLVMVWSFSHFYHYVCHSDHQNRGHCNNLGRVAMASRLVFHSNEENQEARGVGVGDRKPLSDYPLTSDYSARRIRLKGPRDHWKCYLPSAYDVLANSTDESSMRLCILPHWLECLNKT